MKLLKCLFLASSIFIASCGHPEKGDAVLARFKGGTITESEFTQKVAGLPADLRKAVIDRRQEFLQEMVDEHFLAEEARKRKIEDQPEVKELLEAARRKILIAKLIETEVDRKIQLEPDEALHYYDANREQFMTPLLLRASQILVQTKEEAQDIRRQILAGADFEELAREKSLDPTAIRGGDIGFFQKGQLIPEFEEVVFNMEKGELSDVVQTQHGFHVVKLTDRAEPALRDFRLVKGILERRLLAQKRLKLYREYLDKLRGNVKVDIDEEALDKTIGKIEGNAPAAS